MKVFSSLAVKAAYLELVPRFEKSSAHKVSTEWVGMADIRKRMMAGESPDLVVGSGGLIDELIKAGKMQPGSRADLAKSGVAVAVRKGAPRPDIGSVDALVRALRAAKSLAYSSGPSGVYLASLFQRLGIAEELKSKATQTPPGVLVGELVARGEYEIGFQQIPELMQVSGIDIVGPLPAEIQTVTVFAAGIPSGAKERDAAQALVKFLRSPEAAAVFKAKGMQPA